MSTFIIKVAGAFGAIEVRFRKGVVILAESDAMVTKSQHVVIEGSMPGGILGGISRQISGESLFLQRITSSAGEDNDVLLAPSAPGDVFVINMVHGQDFLLSQGCFLACEDSIVISTQMQSFAQGIFSQAGLCVMRASGSGQLAGAALGSVVCVRLNPGEIRDVDNGHLVAWSANMQYTMQKSSRTWMSSITSGEGLVCRFVGPGVVYIQTRNRQGLYPAHHHGHHNQSRNVGLQCGCMLFCFLFVILVCMLMFIPLIIHLASE